MKVFLKYKELSLENIWSLVRENEELLEYILMLRKENNLGDIVSKNVSGSRILEEECEKL